MKRNSSGCSLDAWRVRREFGCIPDEKPRPKFKEGEPLGDALRRTVSSLGVPAESTDALRIERDWAAIVGPDVAKAATPGDLANGVLTVRVGSSVWFAELRRSANTLLLPKLNAALGRSVVKKINLVFHRG